MIDFIGIGAQKSGTSWIYACLYEHPQICAPIKEIHFFSRPRYEKGTAWYLSHFKRCDEKKLRGEFSTSYLYSSVAAERIKHDFPNAKIIASIRNPINRAFSQYRNAIKAGEVPKDTTFTAYSAQESSVIEQGFYYDQLKRYMDVFPKDHVLMQVYEDSQKDPHAFIKEIYTFLGIDNSFVPTLLHRQVNTARTPRFIGIDKIMIYIAEFLRQSGFDRLVWMVKKSGIPKAIRRVNTEDAEVPELSSEDREMLKAIFRPDAQKLSEMLGRDMAREWELV